MLHLRHGKHLLVGLLEGIDALLEVNVVGGELGLQGERVSWGSRQ